MLQTLHILVPGTAKPQGSKNAYQRGGHIVLVEANKMLKPWRTNVTNQVIDCAKRANWQKLNEHQAATVSITFWLPRPKSVAENKRFWPTVKPDLDKLTRAILDAITASHGVWQDDAQVISLHVSKHYTTNEPHTVILVNRA